jgi:hypothetical protein
MTAYEGGVFTFRFNGDTTYTDSQAVEWYWNGVSSVSDPSPIINGVRVNSVQLAQVNTLQECIDNDQTFFYDAPDLYVHYPNSANDYAQPMQRRFIQKASIFLANNMDRMNKGYFGNTYYEPTALDFGGFSVAADPLKLGLIAANKSTVNIQNNNGKYDDAELTSTIGAVSETLVVPENEMNLNNARTVFKGFTNGADQRDKDIKYAIEEQRFFYDTPICPNTIEDGDYVNSQPGTGSNPGTWGIDDSQIGKPYPVAFGDIRRGICVPTNSKKGKDGDTYVEPTSGSHDVVFLLADPAISTILSVTALYDDDDNEVAIKSTDLVNNTVTFEWAWSDKDEKPKFNFNRFSWEGTGFDIPGTYNNGLDIMKFCLTEIGNLIFASGVFDVAQWNLETALNTEAIGLSIRSTRGITREVIQPITSSLQGVVLSRGTGELTFISRDITAQSVAEYDVTDIFDDFKIEYDASDMVSTLIVEYAPNFAVRDDALQIVDSSNEQYVIDTYGIKRRDPLSPFSSVLFDEAEAQALAEDILTTSIDPQREISFTIPYTIDFGLEVFDMITVNTRRYGEADRLKRVEVLRLQPNYNNYTVKITGRITEDNVDGRDIVYGGTSSIVHDDVFNAGTASDSFTSIINPGGV